MWRKTSRRRSRIAACPVVAISTTCTYWSAALDQHHGEEQRPEPGERRPMPAGGSQQAVEAPAARRPPRARARITRSSPVLTSQAGASSSSEHREHQEQRRRHLRAVGRARRARAATRSWRSTALPRDSSSRIASSPLRGSPARGAALTRLPPRARAPAPRRRHLLELLLELLLLGEARVEAAGRDQLGVAALLDDAALVEHDDPVGARARSRPATPPRRPCARGTPRRGRAGSPPRSRRRRSRACRRGSGCSGRSASARASAVRWRCPPESITPRSPTMRVVAVGAARPRPWRAGRARPPRAPGPGPAPAGRRRRSPPASSRTGTSPAGTIAIARAQRRAAGSGSRRRRR